MVLAEFPLRAKSCTSKNKLCMLSDTQTQLLVLMKKGKIQGCFLTSKVRTVKRNLDHFKFSKVIFILKHITVRLNKPDTEVIETHSFIYLPIGSVIKCIHLYLDSYVYSPTKSKAGCFASTGTRRPAQHWISSEVSEQHLVGLGFFPHDLHRYAKGKSVIGNFCDVFICKHATWTGKVVINWTRTLNHWWKTNYIKRDKLDRNMNHCLALAQVFTEHFAVWVT